MGLNLPMLIANSQTLDSWNSVGQYSPPISGTDHRQHHHLRVSLPMSLAAAANTHNDIAYTAASHSIFGGSSNSDLTSSPQKPMDTTDIDEKDEKPEQSATASTTLSNANDAGTALGGVAKTSEHDRCSSPIPNTNQHVPHTTKSSSSSRNHELRDEQEELDIKQELVDFFHAPQPPAPPESQRSYSSHDDDNRLSGGEDFAQDLRVSAAEAAAAAVAAKALDFGQFVLPSRQLRRSCESIDEKFSPLNMRKLNAASAAAAASSAAAAGQMLMHSLLSNESMSEDNNNNNAGNMSVGGSNSGRGGKGAETAAAAAAIYAESLQRDDCDYIGSNVSLKLRSMDRTQRIIAEKLISEVLFYGQFNELERGARIQPK